MYRVEASSLGALTGTGPWAGRVLSVHPRAINILREDGLMVSVLADRAAMSAMGILARTLFESLPDARIVGAGARFEPGLIAVDTACRVIQGSVRSVFGGPWTHVASSDVLCVL
jgi:hypothetical protein